MKKISPAHYAQAYYELMNQAKSDSQREKITLDFIKTLSRNNVLKDCNLIISNLEEISDRKDGVVKAVIISAFEIQNNKKIISEIENLIKKQCDCKKVNFKFEVNKSLISGLVIKTKNETFDLSLKNQIINLKHKLKEI